MTATPATAEQWLILLKMKPELLTQDLCEKFYLQFPNSVLVSEVVSFYLQVNAFDRAKSILQKVVQNSPWVEIWLVYIEFLHQTTGKPVPVAVYQKAVESAGGDPASYPLWSLYLEALREKNEKAETMRQVYHSALIVSMHQVGDLWAQYVDFEEHLVAGTNTKISFDAELLRRHQVAKMLHEAESRLHLQRAFLYDETPAVSGEESAKQLAKWRSILRLRQHCYAQQLALSSSEVSLLMRVLFRQMISQFWRSEVCWVDYALIVGIIFLQEEAAALKKMEDILGQGLKVMPTSILLQHCMSEIQRLQQPSTSDSIVEAAESLNQNGKQQSDYAPLLQLAALDTFASSKEVVKKNKKGFREIGKTASSRNVASWHLYQRWAEIESEMIGDQNMVREIYKRGLQKTGKDWMQYIPLCFHCQDSVLDEAHLRGLLEESLQLCQQHETSTSAKEMVWNRFLHSEKLYYGTHSQRLRQLEDRQMQQLDPCRVYLTSLSSSVLRLSQRYSVGLLYPESCESLQAITMLRDMDHARQRKVEDDRGEVQSPLLNQSFQGALAPTTCHQLVLPNTAEGTHWSKFVPPTNKNPPLQQDDPNAEILCASRAMRGAVAHKLTLDDATVARLARGKTGRLRNKKKDNIENVQRVEFQGMLLPTQLSQLIGKIPNYIEATKAIPASQHFDRITVATSQYVAEAQVHPTWLIRKMAPPLDLHLVRGAQRTKRN